MPKSNRWHDGTPRFPEDELLRWGGFTILYRPLNKEPIWEHPDGTWHTHIDAIGVILYGFGYHRCGQRKGVSYWADESEIRHTTSEVVAMIRMKLRDYAKVKESPVMQR